MPARARELAPAAAADLLASLAGALPVLLARALLSGPPGGEPAVCRPRIAS